MTGFQRQRFTADFCERRGYRRPSRPLGRVLPAAAELARAPRPAAVGVGQVGVTQPAPGLEGPRHRRRDRQDMHIAGGDQRDARARAAR
jgi:hypothetical protein